MRVLPGAQRFGTARKRMVNDHVAARGVTDPRVLEALLAVPRHEFADEALAFQAYGAHALPIGHGQTLSQPYVVGRMTEALDLCGDERILEVGTGSGYQAAILSLLARTVFTMERIPDLARHAGSTLAALGISNVIISAACAGDGWPEHAPFDRILMTAGATEIPPPLLDQLGDPGVLVAPLGADEQNLIVVRRKGGRDETQDLGPCRFVPFIERQQRLSGEGGVDAAPTL